VTAISVVTVTYNSRLDVGALLDSLAKYTSRDGCEVIVVDNCSADGTADFVAREYGWAKLVRPARNDGLSAGINAGVAASSGEYVAVLNPDVRFECDVLSPLAAYLSEHTDAGIVAPKILNDDGTLQLSCRAFPGYSTALFNRYSLLTKLFPGNKRSRRYLMSDFDHASLQDVDWLSGAALMFPRRVFDELGGWDAGFFLFNEDVDFCRRVQDAGFRVVYDPGGLRVPQHRRQRERVGARRHCAAQEHLAVLPQAPGRQRGARRGHGRGHRGAVRRAARGKRRVECAGEASVGATSSWAAEGRPRARRHAAATRRCCGCSRSSRRSPA
jgi:GT2 family glycosyltransferase